MPEDNQATGTAAPDETTASDNVSPQPSEASEQTSEAPEATQGNVEAQEATTPDTNAEDKAEEKLLAGKFKSVEDMEKSYKELESKYGATASERAELSRTLNDAFVEPEPQVAPEVQQSEYVNDYEPNNPVMQEVEELKRKSAVQSFIINHGDADAASMTEVLAKDPLVKQITGHEAKLEYAYLKSQGASHQKAVAQAEKKGAERTQVKMAEKETAQVESAKKAAPVNDKNDKLERMRYGDKAARAEVIGNIDAVKQMRRMAGME